MFATVLPLFGLIAAGFVAGRLGVFGPAAADSLNRFTVYLALPALLFDGSIHLGGALVADARFVLCFAAVLLATYAASLLLAGRRHRLADRGIEALASAYPNTGFMGIPLATGLLGPGALSPAILAALLTVCALFAVAIATVEFDGPDPRPEAVARRVLRALATNPIVVAPLAGLLWAALRLPWPAPFARFTALLGDATTPCALVTIGLFLAATASRVRLDATLARVLALKLVAQPALAFGLAVLFHLSRLQVAATVLLAALPIGTGPFMLAKLYDREAAETGRAVLFSTVLSFATVPLLASLLTRP